MTTEASVVDIERTLQKASPAGEIASRGNALTCEKCDSLFEVRSHRGSPRRFCSPRCRTAAWRARRERAS